MKRLLSKRPPVQRQAQPRKRAAFKPATADCGIRVYTRPDGISLPYVASIYGEARP